MILSLRNRNRILPLWYNMSLPYHGRSRDLRRRMSRHIPRRDVVCFRNYVFKTHRLGVILVKIPNLSSTSAGEILHKFVIIIAKL
jgi:hypothetical protein